MTVPSPFKNHSRDGSKVVSFWLHPPEIAYLDEYAREKTGGNRTEAVRVLIRDAEKRNGRKRKP